MTANKGTDGISCFPQHLGPFLTCADPAEASDDPPPPVLSEESVEEVVATNSVVTAAPPDVTDEAASSGLAAEAVVEAAQSVLPEVGKLTEQGNLHNIIKRVQDCRWARSVMHLVKGGSCFLFGQQSQRRDVL